MPLQQIILITFISLLTSLAHAATPEPGSSLPPVEVEARGELHLEGDDISYRPWSSDANPGKVHILQYLAGTLSASKIYRPFTDQLKERYEFSDFHVTTIINLDDAIWGSTGFVVSNVESNKRKYPLSSLVLDENGTVLKAWELKPKGGALAVMDRDGTVLYFTQKPMTESEMEDTLELVGSQIES